MNTARIAPRALGALAALALALPSPDAHADEGMWLPEQLADLAERLQTLGLRLDPAALGDLHAHPLAAVVNLGGCSASFVSDEGLIVTNHHCAVGALQQNSSAERNLTADGFLAETRADELWAGPGARVQVTESIVDVTDDVLGAVPEGASDVERFEAIDDAIKGLVAECEVRDDLRCEVATYFAGASYRLITARVLPDVRLVYAPSSAIGFFGGDEDNWMWPRHTGDFTFFRAYVGPDGVPAEHAAENVPYRPAHHLELRRDDLDAGDFVMVAGYPGRTQRYRTGAEMAWARDAAYPHRVGLMEDVLAILDAVGATDADAAVRLQGFVFGVSNYLKNNRGMIDGLTSSGAVERALARDAALQQGTGGATAELVSVAEQARAHAERDTLVGWMGWSVDLLNVANTAVWLAHQKRLPDAERDRGYQERDLARIAERVARVDAEYVAAADEALLAYFFDRLLALDDASVADIAAHIRALGADGAAAAAAIYADTGLGDADTRVALLDATVESLEASSDPVVQLAVALHPLREAIDATAREREGAYARLRPQHVAALREGVDTPLYPDANSTLRVTFGMVRGYDGPDGVWYRPFTTVPGVVAKERDEAPFDVPDAIVAAAAAEEWGPYLDPDLDAVPVNFLSTLDTTGGNSGSPTLDGEGRLCGLLFDGNYESMASDWVFDPIQTRSIHVSTAYMLWVMDRIDGAHTLLEELGVSPSFGR